MINIKRSGLALCVFMSCLACSGDVVAPVATLPDDPLWSLNLNVHRAVMSTVSPYDTLRLLATVQTASGKVVAGAQPVFTIHDSTVNVTADGLITARKVTSQSYVVATVQDTNTHIVVTDTVFIAVTNVVTPSRLMTFSLQVASGDSTKLAVADLSGFTPRGKQLVISASDSAGTNLSKSIPVRFVSRDVNVATVDSKGFVTGRAPARTVVITASTTFYGITKNDSLELMIGYPIATKITGDELPQTTRVGEPRTFATRTIGVGGTVVFGVTSEVRQIDVTFDKPDATSPPTIPFYTPYLVLVGSGDIARLELPDYKPGESVFLKCFTEVGARCAEGRSFHEAGTYTYRSPLLNATGVIIVR